MTVCEFSAPMIPIRIGFSSDGFSEIRPEAVAPIAENVMAERADPTPTVYINDLRVFIISKLKELPSLLKKGKENFASK